MKILFINPPFQRLKGVAHIYFPLGLGYLNAAVSRDKRVNAMIYNAELSDFSERLISYIRYQDMFKLHKLYLEALNSNMHYVWQEAHRIIKDFNPDLIGLSVMTAKYGSALKVSQIAKALNENCKIIWGGPHPTVDADRVLHNPCVDFVVRGEGETTLKNLIDLSIENNGNLENQLSMVAGLSYKVNSKIFHNPNRALIEDLDSLDFPAKDNVFFNARYLPSSWGDIITLRGCPFLCGYCGAHNTWTYKVRYRSPETIAEEINMIISKYRTREFYFWDDNFTLNRDRTLKICQLLKKMKMRISWGCTTRVDLLDDFIIKEMKHSGCNNISIGIETGSEKILKNIHKGIGVKAISKSVDLLNKYHLRYEAFFMMGFPDETKEDLQHTFNFMKELRNAKICLSIFTPYPGTEQYEIARRYKLIPKQPDWSHFSHQSQDNHFIKNIEKEEFKIYVEKISSWIDKNNNRNIDIVRLFWNSYLNFSSLINNPHLLANKIKTFFFIMIYKIKILFGKYQEMSQF